MSYGRHKVYVKLYRNNGGAFPFSRHYIENGLYITSYQCHEYVVIELAWLLADSVCVRGLPQRKTEAVMNLKHVHVAYILPPQLANESCSSGLPPLSLASLLPLWRFSGISASSGIVLEQLCKRLERLAPVNCTNNLWLSQNGMQLAKFEITQPSGYSFPMPIQSYRLKL